MADYSKYRLTLDRVLIRSLNFAESGLKKLGMVAPESLKKEGTELGLVLAVGPGGLVACPECNHIFSNFPVEVKVGDKIIFKRYEFEEIIIDDEKLLILYSRSIIGIIEE